MTRTPFSTSPRPVKTALAVATLVLAALSADAADGIQVLGLFKDRAVIQAGDRQRVLRAGETSPEGVTLISANPREAVLEVAGQRGTYALGSRISTRFASADERVSSIRLWPGPDGMYTTSGSINGFPVTFLVDTGASKVAMNAAQAKRLGIDYRVVGKPSMAATASGVVQSFDVVLQRVTVGEIELSGIEAGVIDGPHPREALLGMSFLQRLDMTRKGRLLELRKRP
jgi:aspartyl protease family protein